MTTEEYLNKLPAASVSFGIGSGYSAVGESIGLPPMKITQQGLRIAYMPLDMMCRMRQLCHMLVATHQCEDSQN